MSFRDARGLPEKRLESGFHPALLAAVSGRLGWKEGGRWQGGAHTRCSVVSGPGKAAHSQAWFIGEFKFLKRLLKGSRLYFHSLINLFFF